MITIVGKLVTLKPIKEIHANYILKLRTNEKINKFLSKTSQDLMLQKEWLRKYLIREKEGKENYFIVVNNSNNEKCGTVRIYDIDLKEKKCTWGSFILDENRPQGAADEVISLTLDYIVKEIKIKNIFLDVHKDNKKAIYIYEKNKFIKYKEDENNFYYIKKYN